MQTPFNFRVYAWWKDPAKCFKICYISCFLGFFMHKTYQILKGFPRTFCQADILILGILGAYCSLDTFFCANILICYIMQKQIHSTYLYKLFYLKWQLGLLDIENKEIIWYEFVKPNWNLFENFPKLIRIAEKKKKIK